MADCAQAAALIHKHMCTCPAHGYTQGGGRWGNDEECSIDFGGRTYVFRGGDRDCSSSICDAWQRALEGTAYEGALDGATYTGDMRDVFVGSGLFSWEPMSFTAQTGDIYLNERSHTAMCQSASPDMLSEFCIDENGNIIGGQVGDQTGLESVIRYYYDFPWDGILHYNGKADEKEEEVTEQDKCDIAKMTRNEILGYVNAHMNEVDVYQLLTNAARPQTVLGYTNPPINGDADVYQILTDIRNGINALLAKE